MTLTSHHNALPPGSALMEYRLNGLLGAGAFGITYLARDTHLDKDVAIKEYLPSGCAARAADGAVVPITQQQAQDYRWGLDRFSQEARTLARFSHPHIVRVIRYFEANGTGYMVMDYERGESLKAFAQAHQPISEAALLGMIRPLLDGLEKVHGAGFLHRDIKPDNIFLREDGGPVLLDFGSARPTTGGSEQALTTIVTPGYAPFEQYTTSKQQGPWSDIYSMGGVLYFLLTGRSPPDALTRMKGDTLGEQLAPAARRYSPALIEAIGWAMALDEKDRPTNVASWRDALLRPATTAIEVAAPYPDAHTLRLEPHLPTSALHAGIQGVATVRMQRPEPTLLRLEAATITPVAPASAPTQHVRGRTGLFGYLMLIGVTAALGAAIATLPAFRESLILDGRLSAALIAQLSGSAGAVAFAWLLGRYVARRFRAHGGPSIALHAVLMPIVTLVALAGAYAIVHGLLAPALEEALIAGGASELLIAGGAWGFLLAVCACTIWLSMAVFSHAEPLRQLLREYQHAGGRDASAWASSKEK